MKWKDLSLKERKQIYDSVRANNPDATYFDIKEQFDSIPTYEDGKESKWLTNSQYRDSIMSVQDSIAKLPRGSFKTPTLEELANDSTVYSKPGSNGIARDVDLVTQALKKQITITPNQIKQAQNNQYENKVEKIEPLKQFARVSGILGQMALGGGSIIAKEAGNATLASALQGVGALWDGVESIEAIQNNDKTGIVQNIVPVVAQGLTGLHMLKTPTTTTRLIEDSAKNLGPIWDFAVNPIIEVKKQEVPAYEDGKGKTINKADLPPEYRTGTPEYFERQRKISGAVNTVQPEAYITPAGYIKDAVNFIEDLGKGDYAGAAMDAVLNLIPWGVGKGIKKLKSKVGRIVEGTEIDGASVHSFAPTQTKKKTRKKTEEDYDSEFSEVLRKDRNSKKYQQEISRTIEQAIFPDERTRELVENVDKTYGTNYKLAYSNIAYKDMTKRGSYVKWGDTDKDGYGQINIKNIKDNVLPTDINDYNIILDNNIYMPGTANHELGHVADGLAGSRKIQDFDSGKEYITNTYLNYLANPNNAYSSAELRKMGLFDAAGSRSYLLNPTEAKSHMLTLKRSLKDSGKITNWSTPVDEKMILEYMRNPTSNKMVKNQYDLYRSKNEYIDRLNKLIPMEILMPLGGAGFIGNELNKE